MTPDEIPDPHDLAMELRVNGEVRQESHSSRTMSVTIPEILSNFSALGYSAGDVLSTGTVSGVAGFKSPEERALLYLKPGDVIEAEIEHIGVLRNPVISWQEGHGEPALPRIRPWGNSLMAWERDDAKLDRVRALMAERELDALVVRAPDNVLYLTNFWGMKGYDACRVPAEGEPAADLPRGLRGGRRADVVDEGRSPRAGLRARRPATGSGAHARGGARGDARTTSASGSSCRWGRRRPTGWSASRRPSRRAGSTRGRTRRTRCRCSSPARSIKTAQEVERMRLANEICAAATEHVRGLIRPGMKESEVAALWQGFVHGQGTGWNGQVELAFGFSLIWAGRGIKTFTATGDLPVVEGEPTLFEIWVCADGYWADHTKLLCIGELREDYRVLEEGLLAVYRSAIDHCEPGASMSELDVLVRNGLEELGYPGQPTHPICHGIGARAHEPPYPHRAAGGDDRSGHGARNRARLLLGRRRRPARRGQLPDHRDGSGAALAVPRRGRFCLS